MRRRVGSCLQSYLLIVVCSPLVAVYTSNAAEAPDNPALTTRVDFFSRYVWRGLAWSEGPVMQPSVGVSFGAFSATGWANVGMDRRDGSSLNEVDIILSYQTASGNMAMETCLQFFTYPNSKNSPATGEAVVSVSYPVGPLRTYVSHASDFVHYRGSHYTEIGFCYTRDLGWNTSLEISLGVSAGSRKFNDVYAGVAKSAWNVASLQVTLEHELSDGWGLSAQLSLSELLDSDLWGSGADRSLAVFGIGIVKTL